MNEQLILEFATALGYQLAMSGAETFRIEESVTLVIRSYGLEPEVYALPNCLIVTLTNFNGINLTKMRRIGVHGNDLNKVEQLNSLSRRVCAEHPTPEQAMDLLRDVDAHPSRYRLILRILGHFMGCAGFGVFYGGNYQDAICAGFCGILILFVEYLMTPLKATQFFRTFVSALAGSFAVYAVNALGLVRNVDSAIIGTVIILVPGLLFTNSLRDIMHGDTNSGINRIMQVLLIAAAIALGTAASLSITSSLWGAPDGIDPLSPGPLTMCVATFVGCSGFAILFNIHGRGAWLCTLGGVLTWAVYLIVNHFRPGIFIPTLCAALFAALYSEITARIRKYPVTSYLVLSIFPLLPGAGIYYTMRNIVQSKMELAASEGFETAAYAGGIALGLLLVSTCFRLWTNHKYYSKQ